MLDNNNEARIVHMDSVWGDVFEISVKRGILSFLVNKELILDSSPALDAWRMYKPKNIAHHCVIQSQVVDANAEGMIRSYNDHLSVLGYGLGWTVAREWHSRLPKKMRYKVVSIWSPFDLNDRRPEYFEQRSKEEALKRGVSFAKEFKLDVEPDWLCGIGAPANADFMMLLEGRGGNRKLLCVEFSMNVPYEIGDYSTEAPHASEVSRYVSLVASRGVFSNLAAEVKGIGLDISKDMISHLGAFTSRDKPLYKLMQGCSYTDMVSSMLRISEAEIDADIVAVTAIGIETISAPMGSNSKNDVRRETVEALGKFYRNAKKSDKPLEGKLEEVYRMIRRSLPMPLKKGLDALLNAETDGRATVGVFEEEIVDFLNPATPIPIEDGIKWASNCDSDVSELLGQNPNEAFSAYLRQVGKCDLRTLNEASIATAIKNASFGSIRVLGLLGHPGIGKTTSLLKSLSNKDDGCFFSYFSPRVVINGDVTSSIIEKFSSGSLAITTNHALISASQVWAKENGIISHVTGAVIVEGSGNICMKPNEAGGCLHLNARQGESVTEGRHWRHSIATDLDERQVEIDDPRLPGVLRTLATECRELMNLNPNAPTIAITAAIQGFKSTNSAKTTVDALGCLFRHKPDTKLGVAERRAMAQRCPLIVVMVDEITGDGAGAPMVHALKNWLHEQFIAPFDNSSSPFKIVLVLADASLSNPDAFRSFLVSATRNLNGDDTQRAYGTSQAPPRLMISPATRPVPFGLSVDKVRIGSREENVLHVMADGYPASKLVVEYVVRLDTLNMTREDDSDVRKQIREEHGERILSAAVDKIIKSVAGDPERQVIYFAQDKAFLKDIRNKLITDMGMAPEDVVELHSSIDSGKRRILVSKEKRDNPRVYLMTSAGSRGVSFPKATTIIIAVPRFNVESSLMEIGQMIFRGRGGEQYPDANSLSGFVSGDNMNRRLIFMIEDYAVTDRNQKPSPVLWARRKIDLASLILLLRASIETRVKGASRDGFKASVVPVGHIGVDETTSTMASVVKKLMKECKVAMRELGGDIANVARAAHEHAMIVFVNYHWRCLKAGFVSFSNEDFAADFTRRICHPSASLVRNKGDSGMPVVPDHSFFIGSTIIEDWSKTDLRELFGFGGGPEFDSNLSKLIGSCLRLIQDSSAPHSLASAAAAVLPLISRKNQDLRGTEFTTSKKLGSNGGWIVLPTDYSRFITNRPSERDSRLTKLARPDLWLDWMQASAGLNNIPVSLAPVVPEYDDKPFCAAIVFGDPTGMERAFDPNYFMSTTEFNLLNALLFSSETE